MLVAWVVLLVLVLRVLVLVLVLVFGRVSRIRVVVLELCGGIAMVMRLLPLPVFAIGIVTGMATAVIIGFGVGGRGAYGWCCCRVFAVAFLCCPWCYACCV